LGNVSEKIRGIIQKVQAKVDAALEKVAAWIDKIAGSGTDVAVPVGAIASGTGKPSSPSKTPGAVQTPSATQVPGKTRTTDTAKTPDTSKTPGASQTSDTDPRTYEQKQADLHKGVTEAEQLLKNEDISLEEIREKLPNLKLHHKLARLELIVDSENEDGEKLHIRGEVNPTENSQPVYRNLRVLVTYESPINSKYRGQTLQLSDPALKTKYPKGIKFDVLGFPDFRSYAKKIVKIEMQGNRGYGEEGDMAEANEKAGYPRNMRHPDHTWHHHQDRTTMMLIPFDLHDAIRHSGGVWVIKKLGRKSFK
jgi:hypothetical protein